MKICSIEREGRGRGFFCTACWFFSQILPCKHFLDSMSRREAADVSISQLSQICGKVTRRKNERAKGPCSESCRVLLKIHQCRNIVWRRPFDRIFRLVVETRTPLDAPDASWERRARVPCRCFIVRQRDWYIARTIPPRGNVISDHDGLSVFPS